MTVDVAVKNKQRDRLIRLLKELFQLDQPDLDFGFYKIMHAKADTVSNFLEEDLLRIIQDSFGKADEEKISQAQQEYKAAIKTAKTYRSPDPKNTDPVKKAKAAYDAAKDISENEVKIYEDLYHFFERYYDNGDFMSRRYLTRETEGRAAPYAVPYDGSEVYLHWANRDQYYIKTSEHLTNFTFDIAKHFTDENEGGLLDERDSLKLHCRIVEATEGEHGNNKVTDKTERFFIICRDEPVLMEDGELVLQFEYRPDEKTGKANGWQEKRLDEAEMVVLNKLRGLGEATHYDRALRTKIVAKKEVRTLLRKYLNKYTKRNTADYFIHKDLGSFLKRELDFYIKNEIMRLDDIMGADAPRVESYLERIKVLREIAGCLIDFLAQLENFQKKLWLKKKFVTETQYCITLDRVPESFYGEIAGNEAQRAEWVKLFSIDALEGFGAPLSADFLKANPFLVLDTAFFSDAFKDALLAELSNLDESLDGLLIHSENFQALTLMQEKYKEQVKCIYIDPPYNTAASEILYKNNYKHSSWLSLIQDRLILGKNMLDIKKGLLCATIDDVEHKTFSQLIEECFIEVAGTVAIRTKPSGRPIPNGFAIAHEYAVFGKTNPENPIKRLKHSEEQSARYREEDDKGAFFWEMFRKAGSNSNRENRPTMYYPFFVNRDEDTVRLPKVKYDEVTQKYNLLENPQKAEVIAFPIKDDGTDGCWYFGYERALLVVNEFKAVKQNTGDYRIYYRRRPNVGVQPTTHWSESKYSATEHGTNLVKGIFGVQEVFSYPKSIHAVTDCLNIMGAQEGDDGLYLDYFAGSGTTGHAVVKLNREDGGRRKYIMVEMGHYFNVVTKPRMQKIIYASDWKEGKPASRDGISHAFKYIRLESYEDTLNNLISNEKTANQRKEALKHNPDFRRDYMLKYWLEFETKTSPSLLNIDQFANPADYRLNLKKPGSEEYEEKPVDLIETFNWLIGLHITRIDQWRAYNADFTREPDQELPKNTDTRLTFNKGMEETKNGKWQFRKVEGQVCRTPGDMNNTDSILIIWRNLTGNPEEDNLMLDKWFEQHDPSTQENQFNTIYVNGSNNLADLVQEGTQVLLIEETFHEAMWRENP